jgi:hypothetical protein
MKRIVSVAFALSVMCSASASFAQAPDASVEQAKMLFNAGTQAYAKANYTDAIKAFVAAYQMAPRPTILFSLAQAERRQYFATENDQELLRTAIGHFRQYLNEVKEGGRRADAVAALGELEAHVPAGTTPAPAPTPAPVAPPQETQLVVSTATPNATVWLDGEKADSVPLIKNVQPGKHHIKVSADGYFDDERDVTAVKGVPLPVDVPLREKPALVSVSAPDGSDVAIDGRFIATTPLNRPIEVAPGAHLFAVTKNGYKAYTSSMRLERNQHANVAVHFDKTPQRVTSLVLLGTGAASVVAGGVFTVLSFSQQSKAQKVLDQRNTQNILPSDVQAYNDAVDARDRWKTVAMFTYGAGAALIVTGGVLYLFDRPQVTAPAPETPDNAPKPAPEAPKKDMEMMGAAPIVGPGMLGAGVFGRF